MELKKSTLLIMGVLILGVVGFSLFGKTTASEGSVGADNGAVQQITLSEKGTNYYPREITVKAWTPVALTLDSSVVGCLRSFTVPDLHVKGYSANPSQLIQFTPTTPGTYRFACSMGMGYGTLIVQ